MYWAATRSPSLPATRGPIFVNASRLASALVPSYRPLPAAAPAARVGDPVVVGDGVALAAVGLVLAVAGADAVAEAVAAGDSRVFDVGDAGGGSSLSEQATDTRTARTTGERRRARQEITGPC